MRSGSPFVIAGLTRNPGCFFSPIAEAAIQKEKQIKNWKREWKIALIEKENPQWLDLYESIL